MKNGVTEYWSDGAMEIPFFTSQQLHVNQIQNERVDSDFFRLDGGRLRWGCCSKIKITLPLSFPVKGKEISRY